MAKPIIYDVKAFDANADFVFQFNWIGQQIVKAQALIRRNSDNVVIFGQNIQQNTFKLQYKLPGGSIPNSANPYNISIKVFYTDVDGIVRESEYSTPEVFYCFKAPVFKLNIEPGQKIQNSVYGLELTYQQEQGEKLDQYRFILYNDQKSIIRDTSYLYDTSNMVYQLNNLEDNAYYFVRAMGQTINGLQVDTGYIEFNVSYLFPSSFSSLELTNRYNYGDIKIESNFIAIDGTSGGDAHFSDGNTTIDLTAEGAFVDFNKGYWINDDYRVILDFYMPNINKTIMTVGGRENILTIKIVTSSFDDYNAPQTYLVMWIKDGDTINVLNSNYINRYFPGNKLRMVLTRKDYLYDLELKTI